MRNENTVVPWKLLTAKSPMPMMSMPISTSSTSGNVGRLNSPNPLNNDAVRQVHVDQVDVRSLGAVHPRDVRDSGRDKPALFHHPRRDVGVGCAGVPDRRVGSRRRRLLYRQRVNRADPDFLSPENAGQGIVAGGERMGFRPIRQILPANER